MAAIGPVERLLIIVLAGAGAEAAIAAVVAAKGGLLLETRRGSTGESAEEFLIGLVSSWILAASCDAHSRCEPALSGCAKQRLGE